MSKIPFDLHMKPSRRPLWIAVSAALLLAGCSASDRAGSPGSQSPTAGKTAQPSGLATGATPGATSSVGLRSPGGVSPGATASAPSEPDFSGTGCYPDIPTPFTVTVSSEKTTYPRGEPVKLILDVRATEPSRVEHANAQEFDFALDLDGQEVWRWSSVAPLIAPYHYDHAYRTGETRRFTATWDQKYARSGRDALPGTYVLHGYFIGNMEEPPPPGRFICFDESRLTVT